MAKPYRKHSNYTGTWLSVILGCIASGIALAIFLRPSLGDWSAAFAFGLPIVGIIVAIVLINKLTKSRFGKIKEALEREEFVVSTSPTDEEKAYFWRELQHLEQWAGLRHGSSGIQWFAWKHDGTGQLRILEHEFVTGSGKYTQVHYNTFACWSSTAESVPGVGLCGWSNAIAVRPIVGEGRALEKGAYNLKVGDDEFDKDWALWGEQVTLNRMFNESVRHRLKDSPRGERWFIGNNWTCCSYRGTFDHENLDKFVSRTHEILSLVKP